MSGVVGYLAPRLRGERGETRIRFADDVQTPRSFGEKPDGGRAVRYGDALHLVTCPVSGNDPTHTGRGLRKPHVLTCFKKETSSLLGGYLTIDPRGCALQVVVERPPPELDVVIVGGEKHGIPEEILRESDLVIRIPMTGFVPSFNLQAPLSAVAIEAQRQRN